LSIAPTGFSVIHTTEEAYSDGPTGGVGGRAQPTLEPALPDDQNLIYAGVAYQFNAVAVS
jgi:hypothetical protein